VIQRQYRSITTREYYRLARIDRDTAGRPACTTVGGRRVFGGGGIYPDVLLEETATTPAWLSQMREQDLVLGWVGGYVSANTSALSSLDVFLRAPSIPNGAVAEFRAYAGRQGVVVPSDGATDAVLQRELTVAVARAKWGDAGAYGVIATIDPTIRAAVQTFERASSLLGPGSSPR